MATDEREWTLVREADFVEGRVFSGPVTEGSQVVVGELARIAEANHGEAAWHPESPGEWRCAEALVRRGLLSRQAQRGRKPFTLTAHGMEVGCAL